MYGIVVGIDGSPEAERALDWALAEAGFRDLPLTLVMCVYPEHVSSWIGAYPAESPDYDLDQMESAARATVEKLMTAREPLPSVEYTVQVELGHPADALLRYAADAEHVVVGSRGLGGFQRLLLGSVSTAMVHHAPCPVTVVRGKRSPDDES